MSKQQGAGAGGKFWAELEKWAGLGKAYNSDTTRAAHSLAQNHYVIKVAITAGKAKIEN